MGDPLADFKKRVTDSSSSSVDSMPLIKLEAPKPKAPAGNAKKSNNWMTDALAAWGQEEDQTLDAPSLTNVVASKIDGDGDGGDQGERGDLGESDELIVLPLLKKLKLGESTGAKVKVKVNDGVDAKAAATEQNLDTEIESEAQEAASEVVKSTMDSVERDFLFAEKAITTKLGENAPELTLDDLDKAGGKAKRDKAEAYAKKAHKQMVQKAEQNYELAIANVKKVTQQKLADELVGLKMKLRNEEDKILAESKTASQKAKEDMEATVRNRVLKIVEAMKAKLPEHMKTIKEKAEAEAKEVATTAIKLITQGARQVRMRLTQDLGEAAGRVRKAEHKLSSSDANPSQALKAAVDVRTEKEKYSKLHDLAESALGEQKSEASKKIEEAEENAKDSVKLAVHDAEQKELKESQSKLEVEQKKIEEDEQKKLKQRHTEIKQLAENKIKAERLKFKSLVDAAVKMAPQREKNLRMKAKISLHKAKIAAEAYEEQMMKAVAPKSADGNPMTKQMAAECIKNPAGCASMSLSGENTASAAKVCRIESKESQTCTTRCKRECHKSNGKIESVDQCCAEVCSRST